MDTKHESEERTKDGEGLPEHVIRAQQHSERRGKCPRPDVALADRIEQGLERFRGGRSRTGKAKPVEFMLRGISSTTFWDFSQGSHSARMFRDTVDAPGGLFDGSSAAELLKKFGPLAFGVPRAHDLLIERLATGDDRDLRAAITAQGKMSPSRICEEAARNVAVLRVVEAIWLRGRQNRTGARRKAVKELRRWGVALSFRRLAEIDAMLCARFLEPALVELEIQGHVNRWDGTGADRRCMTEAEIIDFLDDCVDFIYTI